MRLRSRDLFQTVRTEGGLLPADVLARIANNDQTLQGLEPTDYHLLANERITEAIARAWTRLTGAWRPFDEQRHHSLPGDPASGLTREAWLLPLFHELDYGRLSQSRHAIEIEGKAYPVFTDYNGNVPIHLVGAGASLDARTAGVRGAAGQSPHSLVQELLNRSSQRLWGIVTNGLVLRVLRDNVTLTRQAYVQFDLEAMFTGEVYSDFVLLWLVCHQSRLEADKPEECWLEHWTRVAADTGARALDTLRDGVQEAIEILGRGFLAHAENRELHASLRDGTLSSQDYYRQLLRLVYRLLFLFVAEDRDALLDPGADQSARDRFSAHYSTLHLRGLAARRRGGRHHDRYEQLKVVMRALDVDGCPSLGLPALGTFLWSAEAIGQLSEARISNSWLLASIRELAYVESGGVRRSVDFRNLGAEELGSIYESLLELQPEIHRGSATFDLTVVAGHERKTTGSYYTPSSLIKILLDASLDPLIDDAANASDPDAAILSLAICDPACGSGHFLVAAANRIAKRLASIRTGDPEPAPAAVRGALRDVVGHCIFGVDVNPMAVELCKVSLWMEALVPGKPLSFLDHHVLVGNSLLGATESFMAEGIPEEAFKPRPGEDQQVASALRQRNARERQGQLTISDHSPATSAVDAASMALEVASDDSIDAQKAKEARLRELHESPDYTRERLRGDIWCAAFLASKRKDSVEITQRTLTAVSSGRELDSTTLREVLGIAHEHRLFHWQTELPMVFRGPPVGEAPLGRVRGQGFDLIIGNPPFVNAIEGGVSDTEKPLLRYRFREIGGTADLAYYFLALGTSLIRPGGRVALVQPRAVLNAAPVRGLRQHLPGGLRPNLLYAPGRPDLFAGPAVFIALVVLGPNQECVVSRDPEPSDATWVTGAVESENWWQAIEGLLNPADLHNECFGTPAGDIFEVTASMTTGDAYDVVSAVIDEADGESPKLVTTGLIEPGFCLWGQTTCRYLKRDYDHPRVLASASLTKSLQKRVARSHRPKILVAGLTKRIECFLDRGGDYIGAVSTYSIFHPDDNVAELEALCDQLLSDRATQRFRSVLGGNAMGGGNITMKKTFLAAFPYATEVEAKM